MTVLLIVQERPLPRTMLPFCTRRVFASQPMPLATIVRSSRKWQSSTGSPVAKVWPSVSRFFMRNSYGSRPSRSAITSIWLS